MQSHASMSLLQEEIAEEPEYGDAIDSDDDDRFCILSEFELYFRSLIPRVIS